MPHDMQCLSIYCQWLAGVEKGNYLSIASGVWVTIDYPLSGKENKNKKVKKDMNQAQPPTEQQERTRVPAPSQVGGLFPTKYLFFGTLPYPTPKAWS